MLNVFYSILLVPVGILVALIALVFIALLYIGAIEHKILEWAYLVAKKVMGRGK